MKKKLIITALICLLIAVGLFTGKDAHAIGASAGIQPPGQMDEGGQYQVPFSVTTDKAMTANINISVSGGGQLAGVSASPGSVNGGAIVVAGVDGITTVSGTITVNVVSGDPVVISIGGDVTSLDDFSTAGISGGGSIPVRSKAQIESEAEAARQSSVAASEAASRAAAESIAEAERQASIAASNAAEESKRQASLDEATREEAERQASIDASIAEEQSKIAESRAEEESIENSRVAESVSIEESERLESLSIEESVSMSEEKESIEEAEESKSIAESISESESEVNRTKAFEVGEDYFVPWNYLGENGRFLFAVADTNIEPPEGYSFVDLRINRQYVWAAKNASSAAHTFLVYGRYSEDEEAAFYYYDIDTGELFPYDNLNSDTDNRPVRVETEASAEEPEGSDENGEAQSGRFSGKAAALFAAIGAVVGAALVGLILLILKLVRDRKDHDVEEAAVPSQDKGMFPYKDADELEEIPLEEADDSNPDETMKILFGDGPEDELPVREEDADGDLAVTETDAEGEETERLAEIDDAEDLPEEEVEVAAEEAPERAGKISEEKDPESDIGTLRMDGSEEGLETRETDVVEEELQTTETDVVEEELQTVETEIVEEAPKTAEAEAPEETSVPAEPTAPEAAPVETETILPEDAPIAAEAEKPKEEIFEEASSFLKDDVAIISEDEGVLDSVFTDTGKENPGNNQ